MAWGQSRPVRMKSTWGAQTKPCRGEVVKGTQDGEIYTGTRSFGRKGEKVSKRR